jgi:hypothetical protein
MFGGGGGGGTGKLNREQTLLYRDVEKWLANVRSQLGENRDIKLVNPVGSHVGGIKCEVQCVAKPSIELFRLFRVQPVVRSFFCLFANALREAYNPDCSDLTSYVDDESRQNVYHVTIPFPPGGFSEAALASVGSGGAGGWPAFLDEPKVLITSLLVTAVSAVLTTKASQWTNLLAWVLGR